jgi:hypothetical protein
LDYESIDRDRDRDSDNDRRRSRSRSRSRSPSAKPPVCPSQILCSVRAEEAAEADSEAAVVAFPEPVVDSEAAEGSRAVSAEANLEASAPPKVLTLLAALATRPWVVDSQADSEAAAADSRALSAAAAVATSAARVRSRAVAAVLASPAAEAACPAHEAEQASPWAQHYRHRHHQLAYSEDVAVATWAAAADSKAAPDLETSAPPKVRSSRLAGSEPLTLLAASRALAMRPWAVDSEADSEAAAVEAVAISARVRYRAVAVGLASPAAEAACPAHAAADSEARSELEAVEAVVISAARVRSRAVAADLASPAVEAACPAHAAVRSEPEAVVAVATSAARMGSVAAEAACPAHAEVQASPAAEAACPALAEVQASPQAQQHKLMADSRASPDMEASPKMRSSRLVGSEPLMLAASAALAMRPWVVDSVAAEADSEVAADSGARSEAEAVATSAARVRLGAVEAGLASLAVEVACPAHAAAQASR